MVSSAKRAKRKRLAQEAQQRETSRSSHQMDPVDLSEHGTDLEEEDDHEILFPSRTRNTVEPHHRQREYRRPRIARSSIW